ncbi:hypothetical protein GGI43DRAFT_378127 [Trichoderma evansii]
MSLSAGGNNAVSDAKSATVVHQTAVFEVLLTKNKPVGGTKSGEAFISRSSNNLVKSIKFWSNEDRLVAIEINWHFDESGSTQTYGDTSKGTHSKILNLQVREKVKQTSIWKVKGGDAVAYVELETDGVQYFSAGVKPADGEPVQEDVGHGYLLALSGTVNGVLDSLGFLFLPASQKKATSNLLRQFHRSFGITQSQILAGVFSEDRTFTSTQDWKVSEFEEFGQEVSIKGGFLSFIEASSTFKWNESTTKEHGKSWSESNTYHWGTSGILKPGKGVKVAAHVINGETDLKFQFSGDLIICVSVNGHEVCNNVGWQVLRTDAIYKIGRFSRG